MVRTVSDWWRPLRLPSSSAISCSVIHCLQGNSKVTVLWLHSNPTEPERKWSFYRRRDRGPEQESHLPEVTGQGRRRPRSLTPGGQVTSPPKKAAQTCWALEGAHECHARATPRSWQLPRCPVPGGLSGCRSSVLAQSACGCLPPVNVLGCCGPHTMIQGLVLMQILKGMKECPCPGHLRGSS